MNYRSLAKNAGTAFLAQGVAMLLSIIQTLLVPKLLGLEEYGYWQLFLFYASYVGFAHLGLNDGVYLVKGGQGRGEVDKRSVISQFAVGAVFQFALAAVIIAIALAGGFGRDREFVVSCTGVFLVIQNCAYFLMYLLQAMNETRRSSFSTIVGRIAFLVPLVILLVVQCASYKPFIVAYILSSFVQLAYCAWFCRDFFRAGLEPLPRAVRQVVASVRVGSRLMLANIASQLVLGIARFASDVVWGIEAFGEFSFAISMVNFFLAFVSQASMVLFPALRQASPDEVRGFFCNSRDVMSLVFPAVYAFYYPMVILLSLWLPRYAASFFYFIYLIPICVFDSKMNICCTTFFKVLREEGRLLWVNVCTCVASGVIALIGIYVFNSITVVISGAVVSIIARSLWSESYLAKRLNVPSLHGVGAGELLLTVVFVTSALLLPGWLAFSIYMAAYAVFLSFFRERLFRVVSKVRKLIIGAPETH